MLPRTLPTSSPAEVLDISPENLDVANTYLQTPNILDVATALDVTPEYVTQVLAKREVRAYVDSVYYNLGFNNRFKMRSAMDAIISKKFQDMDESDLGSSKDISELLALSHKMTMENLDREIKLETLRSANVKTQNNIQINNNNPGGSKYSSLIETLMKGDVVDV